MNRPRAINLALAFLLLGGTGLRLGLRTDATQRNYAFLPDMARPVAYESQGPNPNTPDGKNLQPPVPGTIARGYKPLHYAATDRDTRRAGEELLSPVDRKDAAALARGAFVWENFCTVCHGASGEGGGPVTKRGMQIPTSMFSEQALARKDGELFHILAFGRLNMPSYASQLDRLDRWKVIAYIRSLQSRWKVQEKARQDNATKKEAK